MQPEVRGRLTTRVRDRRDLAVGAEVRHFDADDVEHLDRHLDAAPAVDHRVRDQLVEQEPAHVAAVTAEPLRREDPVEPVPRVGDALECVGELRRYV